MSDTGDYTDSDYSDYDVDSLEYYENPANKQLETDISLLQSFFDGVTVRTLSNLDETIVTAPLSPSFLGTDIAEAWKIELGKPIFVEMKFSFSSYTDDLSHATVFVYQTPKIDETKRSTTLVLTQLQRILEKFVKKNAYMENTSDYREGPPQPKKFHRSESDCDFLRHEQPPSRDYGFLVQIMTYARLRMSTLNDYCVICDSAHLFATSAMLKPAVCEQPLCVFSSQTLGLGSNIIEEIRTETNVTDLLVLMARAACFSDRRNLIFNPFPTIADPNNPTDLALSSTKRDYDAVIRSFRAFLPMSQLMKLSTELIEFKEALDAHDTLIFPLLQWIISSNRSHIVRLPVERQLKFASTQYQYLLRCSAPAKEAAFRAKKEKLGSVFAFHGSPMDNWHSIMRNGLVVASGSKLQINGAAHGEGIYVSPKLNLSFGYACGGSHLNKNAVNKPEVTDRTFLQGSNPRCVALCEIINDGYSKKSDGIWVVSDPEVIVTRFLFLYESGSVAAKHDVFTTTTSTDELIREAINPKHSSVQVANKC